MTPFEEQRRKFTDDSMQFMGVESAKESTVNVMFVTDAGEEFGPFYIGSATHVREMAANAGPLLRKLLDEGELRGTDQLAKEQLPEELQELVGEGADDETAMIVE